VQTNTTTTFITSSSSSPSPSKFTFVSLFRLQKNFYGIGFFHFSSVFLFLIFLWSVRVEYLWKSMFLCSLCVIMPVRLTVVYVFSYGKYVYLLLLLRLHFSIISPVSIPVFRFIVSSPAFRPMELNYKIFYGLFYDTVNI
jgi:hypothetical protein